VCVFVCEDNIYLNTNMYGNTTLGKNVIYYISVWIKTANINKTLKAAVYPDLSSLKVACCH